jgi:hypothetical protein
MASTLPVFTKEGGNMRIQDLFRNVDQNLNLETEPTTSKSTTEAASSVSAVPQSESNSTSIGVVKTSDQFESFKSSVLDQMLTTRQTLNWESKIYSNQAEEQKRAEQQKLEVERAKAEAESKASYTPTSGIPVDEAFRRNPAPSDVLPKGNDFAASIPGKIFRGNINPDVLIAPSPTKTFRSNVEFYLTKLAGDENKFHAALTNIYGENYDAGKAEVLRKRVLGGDFSWLPKIEEKSNDDLNGHFMAVDRLSNTIYINESKRQPVLGKSNLFEEMNYSSAYGKAIWSAMQSQLDPVDANDTSGKNLGTIYLNNTPRNVEWVDLVDPRKFSKAVESIMP